MLCLFFEGYAVKTATNHDVTRDGQRFLMITEQSNGKEVHIVLNWTEELTAPRAHQLKFLKPASH